MARGKRKARVRSNRLGCHIRNHDRRDGSPSEAPISYPPPQYHPSGKVVTRKADGRLVHPKRKETIDRAVRERLAEEPKRKDTIDSAVRERLAEENARVREIDRVSERRRRGSGPMIYTGILESNRRKH
jgi:hypothetical protein